MARACPHRERRHGFQRLTPVSVVVSAALEVSVSGVVRAGVAAKFCSRLFAGDHTLWGAQAQDEASRRLGWIEDPLDQHALIESVERLRESLAAEGVRRVVLCGMGGSSLAPEVMARAFEVSLTIVDTIHPDVLRPLLEADLSDVVIVVSSKSGGTVETDSLRRMFHAALSAQGVDPRRRIVVVTDPGSPLESEAREEGLRVFLGNPNVGGRFSALTAFGLVPAGLAGVPVRELVEDAHAARALLAVDDAANQGLILGAALALGVPPQNKILLVDPRVVPGFGNWVEQLVAESTGKNGAGLLPVVGSSLSSIPDGVAVGPTGSAADITVDAPLGALFILWEVATVFASSVLGVNPFDQPDVESAKVAARELLDSGFAPRSGEKNLGTVSAWSSPPLGVEVADAIEAVRWLLRHLHHSSYIALAVFGPGGAEEGPWRAVAHALEERTNRPVTLGFGPRFLHSTGQFHKGGPAEGIFIHIIVAPTSDQDIPGRPFGTTELLFAQAHGDAAVLGATGQPVLSLTTSVDNVLALCHELTARD